MENTVEPQAMSLEEAMTLEDAIAASNLAVEEVPNVSTEKPIAEGEAVLPVADGDQTDVAATPDMSKDPVERKHTPKNVEEHFDVMLPDGGSPDTVSLPSESIDVITAVLETVPNVQMNITDSQRSWANVVKDSLGMLPVDSAYMGVMNDPASKWTQVLEYQGNKLYGAPLGSKFKSGLNEIEGENAVLKLMTHLGTGALHYAPLYNSGFWVFFKPAQNVDMLELNTIMAMDKIQLGRSSYGLAHTNHVSYSMSRVFDFALKHVYETSIKQKSVALSDLADYIAPQDMHAFIWGFLCANYPSGFNYERACIHNPEKCTNIDKGNLSISRTLVIREDMLSDWQKNHMRSFTPNSMTLEDVKRYRSELSHLHSKRVLFNKDTPHELAITFKTPTMREYTTQGYKYITSLVDSINAALGEEVNTDVRNAAINRASLAKKLCQWQHFIESIEIGQLSNENELQASIIRDHDSIVRSLEALSSTDSVVDAVIKEIISYVDNSTISLMAIPVYDCPLCHAPQETEETKKRYPNFASYIPLDVLQVFFALLARRCRRITMQ